VAREKPVKSGGDSENIDSKKSFKIAIAPKTLLWHNMLNRLQNRIIADKPFL
jgi:hypothetical protein